MSGTRIVSIDVRWEEMDWETNPLGPAPTRLLEAVLDDHSLVERFLSDLLQADFPYLSFISLKTVTIFHQQHIAQLIEELEELRKRDHDPPVANHLRAVLRLVSLAHGPEDTLIVFLVRQAKDPDAAAYN